MDIDKIFRLYQSVNKGKIFRLYPRYSNPDKDLVLIDIRQNIVYTSTGVFGRQAKLCFKHIHTRIPMEFNDKIKLNAEIQDIQDTLEKYHQSK